MSTRISAGVGDHPCFLNFITMIPIDCKITNFVKIAVPGHVQLDFHK